MATIDGSIAEQYLGIGYVNANADSFDALVGNFSAISFGIMNAIGISNEFPFVSLIGHGSLLSSGETREATYTELIGVGLTISLPTVDVACDPIFMNGSGSMSAYGSEELPSYIMLIGSGNTPFSDISYYTIANVEFYNDVTQNVVACGPIHINRITEHKVCNTYKCLNIKAPELACGLSYKIINIDLISNLQLLDANIDDFARIAFSNGIFTPMIYYSNSSISYYYTPRVLFYDINSNDIINYDDIVELPEEATWSDLTINIGRTFANGINGNFFISTNSSLPG